MHGTSLRPIIKRKAQWTEHGEHALLSAGLSGALTAFGHRIMARVYYADTDFSGVVYHARYLEFFERGRSDFLRLAGVHHTELAEGKHGEKNRLGRAAHGDRFSRRPPASTTS